jgi:hypothetical protein
MQQSKKFEFLIRFGKQHALRERFAQVNTFPFVWGLIQLNTSYGGFGLFFEHLFLL